MTASSGEDEAQRLTRENTYLAGELAKVEEQLATRLPSEREMQYLRERMRYDDNAAWAWQQIRKHLPWVVAVASLIGSLIVWLFTHDIKIGPRP